MKVLHLGKLFYITCILLIIPIVMFFLCKSKGYVLVISGGGARGAYALGIMKGLEELGIKQQIKAIYGVSAGAIVGAYRSAGYPAQEIYDKYIDLFSFDFNKINLRPRKSLLNLESIRKQFKQDLPQTFDKLHIPLYVGAVDITKANFFTFHTGSLIEPVLGSMAVPGAFAPVPYQDMVLADGGLMNNFPIDLAKKQFPRTKIIGIALNKFEENTGSKSLLEELMVGFDILMHAQIQDKLALVDHLFYRNLSAQRWDNNEVDLKKIYQEGYKDCLKHFQK